MSYQSFSDYAKESKRTIQTLRAVCEHLLYGGQGTNKELYQTIARYSSNVAEYMDTVNLVERIQERMNAETKPSYVVWLTYEEWKARGMQVQSGMKATWKNGIPMFDRSQVKPSRNQPLCNCCCCKQGDM